MRRRAPVARPAVGGQGRWNCDALPSRISSDGTRLLRLSSLAALLFSTFFGGAHAGTVINGYWLETNCNPTPARPQAIQVAFPGQCGAETPCNSSLPARDHNTEPDRVPWRLFYCDGFFGCELLWQLHLCRGGAPRELHPTGCARAPRIRLSAVPGRPGERNLAVLCRRGMQDPDCRSPARFGQ
ncbi:hypothetical protein DFJ74DRAFT_275791 [Hyaloraphidium curvatum]|nr:hypothetical protein DFJ74DRAFT_275791 [Hyaloraphidium curvatum]